ncbi:MAG: FAD-dependent oxidoreductase [Cyanobacteriota bacterium]
MPEPILILGGGLVGLSLAHDQARRGRAVTVISRRRSEAAGFVAAGMLAPHAEGLEGPMLELGQRSLAAIPAWVQQIEADSGLRCGLRHCGIVVPFRSIEERDRYPTAAWGTPLDRRELEREIPGLASAWSTGLIFPQDGQIDNRRRLMRALERACVALGVRFQEGSEVLELHTDASRCRLEAGTVSDRRAPQLEAISLQTADGETRRIPCGLAILACGAWSRQLLPTLPIAPVKGQMLSLQGPREALQRVLFGPGTYLVPRDDGLLVVGATSEPEAGFGEGLTPEGQRRLQAGLASLLPEAAGWPPMERWGGFRPCTPDQRPILGPGPIDGLWLATGHHRNGVLLAAITAELLGVALSGAGVRSGQERREPDSTWEAALAPFRWDRFDR